MATVPPPLIVTATTTNVAHPKYFVYKTHQIVKTSMGASNSAKSHARTENEGLGMLVVM